MSALIAALTAQRNQAMDGVAQLSAELAARDITVKELQAKLDALAVPNEGS